MTSSFPYTRNHYYNPVSKIQSLIQNLDAELVQLCKQCQAPKPVNEPTQKAMNSRNDIVAGIGLNNTSRALMTLNQLSRGPIPGSGSSASTSGSSGHAPFESRDTHKRQMRNIYRTRVIDAYRNRRIFTVYGNFHTIRRALLRRGWLEKLPPARLAKLQSLSEETLLDHARRGNDYETAAISKMINHFPSFFIWQTKGQRDLCGEVLPYRNRVRRTQALDFSTKVGLVGCAEQERWFREEGVIGMSYPRFYRLGSNSFEERMAFIDDFQQTQARSLLRYIKEHSPAQLIDEHGSVPTTVLDFALQKVKGMIREMEHYSLDDERSKQQTPAELVENQSFMVNSSEVLKGRARIFTNEKIIMEYQRLASQYLDEIERTRPDFCWDGCRNLWILKPGFQSRGIGIVIRSSLDDILSWSTNNQNRRYIVQKYIERPLLVFKTKFDIRQYMLLTIGESKVNIWMYRDCYLRFSSQEFTMDDLRESIHLTNNSVQKRYKNKQTRDPRLPRQNMWSLDQFKCHLKHVNAPEDAWKRIYNGFKQNLIAVVLASMDETDLVQNAFELYGCDFMVDEHFNPILIEINSSPDLSPSTEVTARICPMALRDLVRVIVDLPKNPQASTGQFERVYQVSYLLNRSPNDKLPLELNGKPMVLHQINSKAPMRTKFIRRIIRTVNKTTSSITHRKDSTREIPKERTIFKKKLKDRIRLKKVRTVKSAPITERPSEAAASSDQSKPINASGSKLNSTTKENLALQYTKVKW